MFFQGVSWKVLSWEPSGDRIARSRRHTAPDLTVKTEGKDRIAKSLLSLDGQNRQSLAFSERGQLSQAIPQFHVERMLNE